MRPQYVTERPMSGKLRIVVSFCACMFILVLAGVYTFFNTRRYSESTRWVTHSQRLIAEARSMQTYVQDIETAQRGYVITGRERYLKPYDEALKEVDSLVSVIRYLIKDNPVQQQLLKEIEQTLAIKVAFATQVIETRREKGIEAASDLMKTDRGEMYMSIIRSQISEFTKNEEKLLSERLETSNAQFGTVVMVIIGFVLLALLILIGTLYFFIKDFNERQRYQREAQESESRMKVILETLPVGVFILDAQGVPYFANKESRDILGEGIVPGETMEQIPETYQTYFPGTEQMYTTEQIPIVRALAGETIIGEENMEIRRGDGKRVLLRVSARPVIDSHGNIEYAIAAFEDISAVKKAEQDLRSAKRQAEEALILKETFLANMSHEIRTPMNAILGFTDLLLKKQLGEDAREYVNIIRSSGENLLRIINDILDISKIEAKMMIFEEHPLSIEDLFKSLSNMLSHKAAEKKLALTFTASPEIPDALIGDPTRLTQIVINLVGNAIKFTRKGSVTVNAKVVADEGETCLIGISVTDTGIGIPEDKLNHIFERFQQAEVYTARSYGGTGLGLSIARQLVELQGGQMTIESEVNKGSTFSFTLRLKKTKEGKAIRRKQTEQFGNFDYIRQLRILMAEDNPINVKLVMTLFAEQKINVDVAENGQQALEMIREKTYDLVLMDLEMPVMNGYEATTIIRKEMQLHIPIIAMTAHAMAGEQEKCYQLGMNEFISKPINVNQLYEKMYQVTAPAGEHTEPLRAEIVTETVDVASKQADEAIVPVFPDNDTETPIKQDIVDLSYLRELSGGNQPFEREMIDLFVQQMPEDVQSLKIAFADRNFPGIKASAHKMKSSVALVGAKYLMTHLAALEKDGEEQRMNDDTIFHFESVLAQLEDCYKALDTIIKTDYTS